MVSGDVHPAWVCFEPTIWSRMVVLGVGHPSRFMAAVTKFIRGYVTDTREYAANTRIRESSIFEHIRAYASIREFAGQYQRLSKFTQIFTNTRIGYSPIRGHTRTIRTVHRDVSAYELGHVSPALASVASLTPANCAHVHMCTSAVRSCACSTMHTVMYRLCKSFQSCVFPSYFVQVLRETNH